MYELEETEKTENGLDFLIKDKDGNWIAWAYNKEEAEKIVDALNGL